MTCSVACTELPPEELANEETSARNSFFCAIVETWSAVLNTKLSRSFDHEILGERFKCFF